MGRGYVCLEMHGRFYAKCGTAIASILIAFILVSRDKNQSKIKASGKNLLAFCPRLVGITVLPSINNCMTIKVSAQRRRAAYLDCYGYIATHSLAHET